MVVSTYMMNLFKLARDSGIFCRYANQFMVLGYSLAVPRLLASIAMFLLINSLIYSSGTVAGEVKVDKPTMAYFVVMYAPTISTPYPYLTIRKINEALCTPAKRIYNAPGGRNYSFCLRLGLKNIREQGGIIPSWLLALNSER